MAVDLRWAKAVPGLGSGPLLIAKSDREYQSESGPVESCGSLGCSTSVGFIGEAVLLAIDSVNLLRYGLASSEAVHHGCRSPFGRELTSHPIDSFRSG